MNGFMKLDVFDWEMFEKKFTEDYDSMIELAREVSFDSLVNKEDSEREEYLREDKFLMSIKKEREESQTDGLYKFFIL